MMWKQGLSKNAIYMLQNEEEITNFIDIAQEQGVDTTLLEKIKINKITKYINQKRKKISYNKKSNVIYATISNDTVIAARRLDDLI